MGGEVVVCTVEARVGSTRLPGKVLRSLAGRPLLSRIVDRVTRARLIDRIVVATVDDSANTPIVELARSLGVHAYAGEENDVLHRVAGAVRAAGAETVVALTGDNPFIDPVLIDDVVRFRREHDLDYVSTTHMQYSRHWREERTFPRGVSVQAIRALALLEVDRERLAPEVREHCAMGIYERTDDQYRIRGFHAVGDYAAWRVPGLRMTVDTAEDFTVAENIFSVLLPQDPCFSTLEAIRLLLSRPDWQSINANAPQRGAPTNHG